MNERPEPSLGGGSVASRASSSDRCSSEADGPEPGLLTDVPLERTNLRLDLSYDGSAFHGFADNVGVRTVGGDLRSALEQVLGQPLVLTVAGRTDTGVHATGQVINVVVRHEPGTGPDLHRLRASLNSMLAPSIAVRGIAAVAADFSARFSAEQRTYHYLVLNSEVPDPFLAGRAWWVDDALDVAAMQAGARHLIGEHDFSSFCRRPKDDREHSLVRRVTAASWTESSDPKEMLRFEITASAFCHQMVRSIVGALVAVGRGRRDSEDVKAMISSRSRDGMPVLAPPHGLYLHRVVYEAEISDA